MDGRPNFLILCMDQWDAHMDVPDGVRFPALERLEAEGVSFDRQYCTVPICTPSRSTMWTGVHAVHSGLWDNTNFAWSRELTPDVPTVGHMLRDQGYYTAFKGKWHLSDVPKSEDGLERYGFADFQQWGDMYGAPLQGAMLDGTAAFETVDWLEHKAPWLEQPWLLISSLVNPHDVMFLQTDPVERPHPNGAMNGLQTTVQGLGWFERDWDVGLPANHDDDLALQPFGVHSYKETIEANYGGIPEGRDDLWKARRNYLINCMRMVDAQFQRIVDALDRLHLWEDTVVILLSDHGEMNGAHRMSQKGAIHYDEAAICNLTVCAPDGPAAVRTAAVGSHLDLAPTLLDFAGLSDEEVRRCYPQLKGHSLRLAIYDPEAPGPRGSSDAPGEGALLCWDALNMLDNEWAMTGALKELLDMAPGGSTPDGDPAELRRQQLLATGARFGAPDFSKRTFYRCVVDGRHKLVRWFSPEEYGTPTTVDELHATGDVTLHDLVNDPGELENIGHPDHPDYDPELVAAMLAKLNALIDREIGLDSAPFSLDLFGTREVKYSRGES